MRIVWARTSAKHGIKRAQVRYVIKHCKLVFVQRAPKGSRLPDDRFVFLGDDAKGAPLEVMAVEIEERRRPALLVIHAMRLRAKYQRFYEEARRWRD